MAAPVMSQDIHWSQFNDNQLFQNPGHAGHFDGDYRFIGNYRDQWRSVTVPFSTTAISVDGKFKKFGIGVNIFNDQAGDGKFRTVEVQGNISYAINLSGDSTHVIRPGINFGMNHRQINWDALYFDSQYNGYVFNQGAPSNETFQSSRKTNMSTGAGIVYEYFRDNRFKVLAGVGAFNLNQPDQGFYNQEIPRERRYNAFVKGTFQLNEKWDVIPSAQFSSQGFTENWFSVVLENIIWIEKKIFTQHFTEEFGIGIEMRPILPLDTIIKIYLLVLVMISISLSLSRRVT